MTPPPAHPASTRPIRRGVVLAALAAMLFGMTAPLLKKASAGVGPLLAGALLYLGAAAGAGLMALGRQRRRRARAGSAADEAIASADGADGADARPAAITSRMLGRLVLVAIVGAAVAPALLVAGLARTDGATASLLLALEAPFTLALAWIFLREFIGGRVLAAALLILGGGAALVAASFGSTLAISGAALVAAAALAWAFDNLFSRPLADRDPLTVVVYKGLLGALASGVAGALAGESSPASRQGAAAAVDRRDRLRHQPAALLARATSGRRRAHRLGLLRRALRGRGRGLHRRSLVAGRTAPGGGGPGGTGPVAAPDRTTRTFSSPRCARARPPARARRRSPRAPP